MYTFDSRIRYSEVDPDMFLTTEALIDYFQDCSTFQSEELGIGLAFTRERNLGWIVVFWQIEIYRRPVLGEHVRIGTSPYDLKGFIGLRNFMMESADGERLAEAASVWTLMDLGTMRPVRVLPEMAEKYSLNPPFDMHYEPRKIHLPENAVGTAFPVITVQEQHLDTNHHVNNGQYVRFAVTALPHGAQVDRLMIEYRRQAHTGDRITPVRYDGETAGADGQAGRNTHCSTVALNAEDGAPYAVAKMYYRLADGQEDADTAAEEEGRK